MPQAKARNKKIKKRAWLWERHSKYQTQNLIENFKVEITNYT